MVGASKDQQDVQNSADSLIRAVLRKTAHVHYSKQSAQRKEVVQKSFYALDTSGDGRISLQEFLQSAEELVSGGGSSVVGKIFSYVDEDKSGFLEFDEFLVVTFIMESGFQICDHCCAPVVIAGYTCKTCWSQRGNKTHDSYDLCASCYIAEGFNHPASHELVETSHMYHYLLTSSLPPPQNDSLQKQNEVKCSICDEVHTMDLKSLFVDKQSHVVKVEGSSQKFVCEWCASCMCIVCGKYVSEPTFHDLQPNQWLRRDLRCNTCVGDGKYQPNVDSILEILKKSELPNNCSTCAKKVKNIEINIKSKKSNDAILTNLITAQMTNNVLRQQSDFMASMNARSILRGVYMYNSI